jgi:hypothetical protein
MQTHPQHFPPHVLRTAQNRLYVLAEANHELGKHGAANTAARLAGLIVDTLDGRELGTEDVPDLAAILDASTDDTEGQYRAAKSFLAMLQTKRQLAKDVVALVKILRKIQPLEIPNTNTERQSITMNETEFHVLMQKCRDEIDQRLAEENLPVDHEEELIQATLRAARELLTGLLAYYY